MIAKIHGVLDALEGSTALVRLDNTGGGGLTYEVLVPAFTAARLAGLRGQPVTLHTFHFIESQGQGTTMIPRLAGFLTLEDRAFYALFTTCKGIGNKRALRAMALATPQIAAAIADRDLALLQTLPEIGRRTAETIVATLRGKVDAFVSAAAYGGQGAAAGAGAGTGTPGAAGPGPLSPQRAMAREALEVLLQFGEARLAAMNWIDQALGEDPPPRDVQTLIARVYQIKAGG
jgi:holliday junction DNA helicase RuvA